MQQRNLGRPNECSGEQQRPESAKSPGGSCQRSICDLWSPKWFNKF